MARSYYMMQQLQQQYAFIRPKKITYAARDGRWLTPSAAHATGAIQDSRLHVEYENGTHVYVNRSAEGTWVVQDHAGGSVELPVSGWLAYNAGNGFYELSANVGGRRIDHVLAPEYEFLDGRGKWTELGSLGAAGSVARRERGGGVIELIDIYGNDRIAFRAPAAGSLVAYDWEGKSLGKVELKSLRQGWHEFRPVAGGRPYVFAPGPELPQAQVIAPRSCAAPALRTWQPPPSGRLGSSFPGCSSPPAARSEIPGPARPM